MNKFLFTIIFILFGFYTILFAQEDISSDEFYKDCRSEIFMIAEIMPIPDGGVEKLLSELNIRVELSEAEKGYLKILVHSNCKGETTGIKLESGFSDIKKKIILEFFRSLRLNPANQNGRNVNCSFKYSIKYEKGKFVQVDFETTQTFLK